MNALAELIATQIAGGLMRASVTSCSRWAEQYRVMGPPFPGKWTFDHHPWLLEMHDSESNLIIGQKAAQMGYTEWAMNTAFFSLDVMDYDVLYILPSSDDASDFSSGRFDPALELSPHLAGMFSNVNNVKLKRAGTNVLYVRGSRSRSKLKSIPTPVIIYDEVDEMDQTNIALSEERQSGQTDEAARILRLSTPTLEDYGINKDYKLTTQEHYMFKCPCCSRRTEFIFPECLKITAETLTDPRINESHYKCKECSGRIDHRDKINFLKHRDRGGTAHFVSETSEALGQGFHINQMYSMAIGGRPDRFALAYLKSLTDPTYEQEFWNSKLALTHAVEGAKVTDKNLADCTGQYQKGPVLRTKIVTMGIDVGAVLHFVIKEWTVGERIKGLKINDISTARIIYEGTSSGAANDFNEAIELFGQYGCNSCIVDAEPERRAALQFAQKLWGRVLLCDYLFSQTGKEATVDEDECTVKVNRTAWLDLTLGRYKTGTIQIPIDTSLAFKAQIREPVRIFQEDKFGQRYGVYKNVKADHFAHADNYAEIALPLAISIATTQDIHGLY